MGLLELIAGLKTQDEIVSEAYNAEDEGNLKLQKLIRKKIQYDDDPNEPFGYRKDTNDSLLKQALRIKFDKEGDARSQKSPEHIQKMLDAKKKNMDNYKDNL
jgi:hypothetical protein